MARWTQTTDEIKHLSNVAQKLPIGGIVSIKLSGGSVVEGVMRSLRTANNGGDDGWKYCGECDIQTESGECLTIDFLGIRSVTNAWTESKAAEYEKRGLIWSSPRWKIPDHLRCS